MGHAGLSDQGHAHPPHSPAHPERPAVRADGLVLASGDRQAPATAGQRFRTDRAGAGGREPGAHALGRSLAAGLRRGAGEEPAAAAAGGPVGLGSWHRWPAAHRDGGGRGAAGGRQRLPVRPALRHGAGAHHRRHRPHHSDGPVHPEPGDDGDDLAQPAGRLITG